MSHFSHSFSKSNPKPDAETCLIFRNWFQNQTRSRILRHVSVFLIRSQNKTRSRILKHVSFFAFGIKIKLEAGIRDMSHFSHSVSKSNPKPGFETCLIFSHSVLKQNSKPDFKTCLIFRIRFQNQARSRILRHVSCFAFGLKIKPGWNSL